MLLAMALSTAQVSETPKAFMARGYAHYPRAELQPIRAC
jgi:hypothetical protein